MTLKITYHDRVRVISGTHVSRLSWEKKLWHTPEGDLDWSLESVNVTVVACSLIGLMLPHQGDQLLRSPALGLEIVIVRRRGASIHLKQVSRSYAAWCIQHAMKLILLPPPRI